MITETTTNEPIRLNLGAGDFPLPGYISVDRTNGQDVFPLAYADESVTAIYASHVLEHFSHKNIMAVLAEWYRVLAPGGWMQIAVPDFEYIAQQYLDGADINTVGYVLGGHCNENDQHGCIFDDGMLRDALAQIGLVDIQPWKSQIDDCASLAVSLNLMGRKPVPGEQAVTTDEEVPNEPTPEERIAAKWYHIEWRQINMDTVRCVMSMPRLGFTDTFLSVLAAQQAVGFTLATSTGVFWGQCLTQMFADAVREGKEYILTIDYDSIFTPTDVAQMLELMRANPHIDALAPLQVKRDANHTLLTVRNADGTIADRIERSAFRPDTQPVATAHFGLTVLRVSAFAKLPKPWFLAMPDPNSEWGDGRTDEDIYFWRNWSEAGLTLHVANHVAIGHLQRVVSWPDQNLCAIHQTLPEWHTTGKPRGTMR